MTEPLRVQFGSGTNQLKGWKNHDAETDITKPLPYSNDTVDTILAEHLLEHVTAPQGLKFLDECHRILKSKGVLRVCVPVLHNLKLDHARDIVLGHGHQMVYTFWTLYMMMKIAGFQDVEWSARKECDGHWRAIGKDKDDLETLRVEAIKK